MKLKPRPPRRERTNSPQRKQKQTIADKNNIVRNKQVYVLDLTQTLTLPLRTRTPFLLNFSHLPLPVFADGRVGTAGRQAAETRLILRELQVTNMVLLTGETTLSFPNPKP